MRLTGFSEVLPGEPVTNRDMARLFGLHEKWLDLMTGNRSRYFCRTDSPPGVPQGTGDLATEAATRALADAGTDVSSLDFLVLSTASPDHLMPATVNLVADRIGLNDVPTFQLTSGCAGALTGLYTARALLASGLRRGLVIGADTCLNFFPSTGEIESMSPAELINFALFGDGAGAAVVEADTDGPGLVVEHLFLRTTGMGRAPAQIARWFGTEGAPQVEGPDGPVRQPWGEEDYKAIEHHVPEHAETIFKELTTATGWSLSEVEHVLLPQLNGVMTDGIRKRLDVRPEQAVDCVADTGNNGNAVPFIQLNRAMQRIRSGLGAEGRLLVANVESSKWILSGLALHHRTGGAS
ncbi:3-oxoacyl-ACP synthase III family protein [Streptomyces sp. DSM 42041]|uniref:3-oxoacyl-ACP synthase III family protein n=1 Tax=Streptomyces hazeniae TaxID=3075538 RepID=A0ABU2NN89_9ACTN|nr:3-oxoacyl-ACP synthase III family protein [Streptomyces sp. DSM 42041]MDT0378440.1 3-oxoacyl-ACP synthase III family protein [Streptomyces sp. DSM 42041]